MSREIMLNFKFRAMAAAVVAALSVVVVGVLILGTRCQAGDEAGGGEHKHTNRLAGETSPYLLMHAHNPVQWYPWGEESLAKAKQENKLIFLSIGYSSCYWCHVMERESFMDDEIAAFLNEHFVSIKVDREERPDVDEIYMTALQAMSGRGGWPLSMFLTPGAEPIIGGTYFPPRNRDGRTGFLDVLKQIHKSWQEQEAAMREQGKRVTEHLRDSMRQRPVLLGELKPEYVQSLLSTLSEQYDREHGGFGFSPDQPQTPKFPEPSNLVFLIDHLQRTPDDSRAKAMLIGTLEKMAQGGIRDHLGGGFHRYSTDRLWRIPHFEKMLYDNGQLVSVYAEAYALTGREEFRHVVKEVADFVLRELTGEKGQFYSSLDAETDAEEGKFYVWSTVELKSLLTEDEFALFAGIYGVGSEPNFELGHVLVMPKPMAELAKDQGLSEQALDAKLAPMREKLLQRRNERERPLRDTKVLTAWNGLMIAGLADAGRILEEPRYTAAAAKAADFVLEKLRTDGGRLMRTYAGGKAKLNAYVDDYAFLVKGLIALHRATGEPRWLAAADELTAKQIELFSDEAGGFFFTSEDHETLIVRSKDPADGAIPSGNSVAAANLLMLADALNKDQYAHRAEKTLRAAIPIMERSPELVPQMVAVLAKFLDR